MAGCAVKKAHQTAILHYAGAPDVDPPEPSDWDSSIRGGIVSREREREKERGGERKGERGREREGGREISHTLLTVEGVDFWFLIHQLYNKVCQKTRRHHNTTQHTC